MVRASRTPLGSNSQHNLVSTPNDLQRKMDPDAYMRKRGATGRRSSCSDKLCRLPSLAESTDEDEATLDEDEHVPREKTRRMSWSAGQSGQGRQHAPLLIPGASSARVQLRRRSSLARCESASDSAGEDDTDVFPDNHERQRKSPLNDESVGAVSLSGLSL